MLQWRYYYKDGEKLIISSEMPQGLDPATPKITMAALSFGVNQRAIEKAKEFLLHQNLLIRFPVFTDKSGNEIEGQSKDYVFYEHRGDIVSGLTPQQGSSVIISSMLDGFDILAVSGGLGFADHIAYVNEYVLAHPQEFIGKEKIKLYGSSDNSLAVGLKEWVQFINGATGVVFSKPADKHTQYIRDTLAVIKGAKDLSFSRQAIPQNEVAKQLCSDVSKLDGLTCYPVVFYFFNQFSRARWPFILPQDEKYSLVLDHVIYYYSKHATKDYCTAFRAFLENLKKSDLPLPTAIEIGDAVLAPFFHAPHENGLMLSPAEVKEKYGIDEYEKLKKMLCGFFVPPQLDINHFNDEAAKQLIEQNIHPFYHQFVKEITAIADDFGIATFVGGTQRLGHNSCSLVIPSASQNSITVRENDSGKYLEISSAVPALRPTITAESFTAFEQQKRIVGDLSTDTKLVKTKELFELEVNPINQAAVNADISSVKTAELQTLYSARTTDASKARIFVISLYLSERNIILTHLQQALLSGALDSAALPRGDLPNSASPVIFAISNKTPHPDNLTILQDILSKFSQQHQITTPLYVVRNFLDTERKITDTQGNETKILPFLPLAFECDTKLVKSLPSRSVAEPHQDHLAKRAHTAQEAAGQAPG